MPGDPLERLFAELDRRYYTQLAPRLRLVTVNGQDEELARVSVRMPGADADISVPYLASYAPSSGEQAWLALVGDSPLIVGGVDPAGGRRSLLYARTSDNGPTSGTTELDILFSPSGVSPPARNWRPVKGHRYRVTAYCRGFGASVANQSYVAKLYVQNQSAARTLIQDASLFLPTTTGHNPLTLVGYADFDGVQFTATSSSGGTFWSAGWTLTRVIGAGTATAQAGAGVGMTLEIFDEGTA
jgi:hypothetical protein